MAVGNLSIPKEHPFRDLVRYLEEGNKSKLDPIWEELNEQVLWLYYQLRFYRNRFVVHGNRPWQRGTTRSIYGNDFCLHTPTPPGWLDDEALNEQIRGLVEIFPPAIREILREREPALLLRACFNEIGRMPKKVDRERVARLYGKKGGLTPTFQILAGTLFGFVERGTALLQAIALKDLEDIDLGPPHPKKTA